MDIHDIVWDENGELTSHSLYSSDVTFEDIPRVIQEHRDLRRAVHKLIDILNQQGYDPDDQRSKHEWERIVKLRSQLLI